MKQREFTAKLGAWVREEQLARGGRKGRAGAVREGGAWGGFPGAQNSRTVHQVQHQHGVRAKCRRRIGGGWDQQLLGARDGGKERWAGLVGHIRARDCFFSF